MGTPLAGPGCERDPADRRTRGHLVSAKGTYKLSEEQARAILDLRLSGITAVGRDEIGGELEKMAAEIVIIWRYSHRAPGQAIVKAELVKFATSSQPRGARRSIEGRGGPWKTEDLIQREEHGRHLSHCRLITSAWRCRNTGRSGAGGKGRSG
jgi:DNA gyrase subunit A